MTAILRATPSAAEALYRKKVVEFGQLVRGRIEAYPGLARLMSKLHVAESKLVHLRHKDAEALFRELDATVEQHERDLVDASERAASQRQDQLLSEAGIDTDRHANGAGTRHGFLWLERKGRVTGRRRTAGQNWGRDYAMAKLDGLRSCLNDNAPGGGVGEAPQERKSEARSRLDHAHEHIRFATGSSALAALLDAVCGRGETLRTIADGDKIGAAVKEAELMIALDMAAEAYAVYGDRPKIVGWREA